MSVANSSRPVAVIFHRFGPYHWARLAAAARTMPIAAVELSAETADYAWERMCEPAPFPRMTVFPEGDNRLASAREIRRRVAAALDKCRPVALAIPGWSDKGALAALEWAAIRRIPVVVMSDTGETEARRSKLKEGIKQQLVGLCAAGLVAGTMAASYLVKLRMPPERISLGYDVVENEHFASNAAEIANRTSEARNQYRLPEQYLLCIARFIPEKNLVRLLHAYARYRAKCEAQSPRCPAWDLVLVGDGPLRSSILQLRSALNLGACIHLPGFKQYNELPVYYALALAFILPSVSETWGLVVNEAMASGLPVLVSNRCGCVPDLVQEGVNGFTFDPYNIEEMAELMLRVSKVKTEALERMGEAGRRIITDWGPERFAQGLKQAVDKALEVGPRKPSVVDRLLLKALMFC